MARIIENRQDLFDHPITEIFWHYSEVTSIPTHLAETAGVVFREGPPALDDYPPSPGHKILVIDDLGDQITPDIINFFLKGSHHRLINIFFLIQNIFNKKIREASLNAHTIILGKTSRDLAQIRTLCLQIDPVRWRAIFAIYKDATDRPGHHYLLCDFHISTPPHLRFRTDILPHEKNIVYALKKV